MKDFCFVALHEGLFIIALPAIVIIAESRLPEAVELILRCFYVFVVGAIFHIRLASEFVRREIRRVVILALGARLELAVWDDTRLKYLCFNVGIDFLENTVFNITTKLRVLFLYFMLVMQHFSTVV